ncbi:MAG: winged helix-turn-helix transcriptional regulator, partial [Nitrososphaerales archaeon]
NSASSSVNSTITSGSLTIKIQLSLLNHYVVNDIYLVVKRAQVSKKNLSKSVELEQEIIDECTIIHTQWNEITKVWTFPVIHALGLSQPARFNELKRRIEGISATSLSERLTELEKQKIISRKVYPETPPKVEYSLTPKGEDLHNLLGKFAEWVKRWSNNNNKKSN